MKAKLFLFSLLFTLAAPALSAAELHVTPSGNDENDGSSAKPLRTIQAAADRAQPGDTITVHEGVYRERVNPPRGGQSDGKRIIYQAAPREKVVIKGSELVKGWEHVQNDTWKVILANSFFGDFNPYNDVIGGHWFESKGREHHTGAVYLDGEWLAEAVSKEEVMAPAGKSRLWFGKVDDKNTTIWAQFRGVNPNKELVEINVRQSVFFPDKEGLNYITVRGFTMCHAATPWAPPTAKQIGLIGPGWSKGWVIENNAISHSVCVGICLGLGDVGLSVEGTGVGYTKLVNYVVEKGLWDKEKIGGHIVRGNMISHCEQGGIVGSFGAAFSLIERNEISNIHTRMLFSGMEQGGIKLHGGIDVVIRGNCVYRTGSRARGIWLDWMAQGAIVCDNLVFDTAAPGLYLEVNHGPILVANNILLSDISLSNRSRGTAYAHNLFGGHCVIGNTTRITPYMEHHSTAIAGMHENYNGDDRFYNNIFAAPAKDGQSILNEEVRRPGKPGRLAKYDDPNMPLEMEGNLYINGAIPHEKDSNPMVFEHMAGDIEVIRKSDGFYIEWTSNPAWIKGQKRKRVTTELLGKAGVSGARFENADGSPLEVDADYFGKRRNPDNPNPGPFESPGTGLLTLKVWGGNGE